MPKKPTKKRIKSIMRERIKLEKLSRGWWDPQSDVADFGQLSKNMSDNQKWEFKKKIIKLMKKAKKPNVIHLGV